MNSICPFSGMSSYIGRVADNINFTASKNKRQECDSESPKHSKQELKI